jgi:hypothetical protein
VSSDFEGSWVPQNITVAPNTYVNYSDDDFRVNSLSGGAIAGIVIVSVVVVGLIVLAIAVFVVGVTLPCFTPSANSENLKEKILV